MAEKDSRGGSNTRPKTSKLFSYSLLDMKDDVDERLEQCHRVLSSLMTSTREAEMYEQLNMKVCRSSQDHEETVLALLFSILTDNSGASKWYSTLTMVTRDSMGVILHITELLILEKFPKLLETTRLQILWLTREMVQTGVSGADRLCFAFLKQMPAGSTAPEDIWLAENLLHLFLDSRSWVENQPPLVASIVYTYLSLLPAHISSPSLCQLQDSEIELIISLIRNKFNDCIQIGRDLLRLLQNVSRLQIFTELWYDIIHNPEKLSATFSGVHQLLSRRTSRRFVAGRIVTDAEIKLNFLLSKVKFGQHRRYQEWFYGRYLSNPDNLYMIPELVRFVCCVIHPPNEVLGSDIMPRWALIGWLLSLCQTNQVIFVNAKLALFYDWIAYSPDTDNIMNIEPAILLMFNSLRTHPQITITLLDFLCRLVPNYCPFLQTEVQSSITTAFRDIVNKGVLQSLDPLLSSTKLDEELRAQLKDTFPEFYPTSNSGEMVPIDIEDTPVLIIADDEFTGEDEEVSTAFSDGDTSIEENMKIVEEEEEEQDTEPWAIVETLPQSLRERMENLRAESDSIEVLDELLTHLETCNYSSDIKEQLTIPILHCLTDEFENGCQIEDTQEEFNITRPYQCLFVHVNKNDELINLLSVMRNKHYKIGYYILYFCSTISSYNLYKKTMKNDDILQQIISQDLKICAQEDNEVFFNLLLCVYNEFSKDIIGSCEMINTIVSNIDPQQLNCLVIRLSLKTLVLFGKQHVQDIIMSSLQWDSFEQFNVWQLLTAEGQESHHIVPVLKSIIPNEHVEAVSGIVILLRPEPSIPGAVGNLLSLPVTTHNNIVSSIISRWINIKPNKMAKFIEYCLGKVQKLNDPLPTLTPMFEHMENTLQYLTSDDVFRGCEMILSKSLEKIFVKYPGLKSRYSKLHHAITLVVSTQIKQVGSNKRRQSSDSDDVIRTKKRRVVNLEELSD